jgi:hypothetical protein
MKRFLILALLPLFGANAAADGIPVVEVEITPAEVIVGESIRLRVTVLGPSWFPQPPKYPSFEVTNAVVRLPPDSSRPVRQRVGSETWTGIVRNYEVIPLIGARYQLDDLMVQVTYANPEDVRNPRTVNVAVPLIEFAAVVPQGAEVLSPYIAGRKLYLDRTLDGDVSDLKVGDALVVRYKAELDGLPSMFIPDLLPVIEIPGASVYADRPEFTDDGVASRQEKLTFVFEAGGDFEIPGASLQWWNSETSAIETASVAASTVSVIGPPLVTAMEPDTSSLEADRWRIAGLVLLAVVAVFVLRRMASVLRVKREARRQRHLESEAYAFEQLNEAIRAADLYLTYERLLVWIERLDVSLDTKRFASQFGESELQNQLDQLSSTLYSNSNNDLDVQKLAKPLGKARGLYLREVQQRSHTLLPDLNP